MTEMLESTRYFLNKTNLARHWRVSLTTVDRIIHSRGIRDLQIRATPQYRWSDVWRLEGLGTVDARDAEAAKAPLLTPAEVAERLGVTSRTVANYVRVGRLRAVELLPSLRRFHGTELLPRQGRRRGRPIVLRNAFDCVGASDSGGSTEKARAIGKLSAVPND